MDYVDDAIIMADAEKAVGLLKRTFHQALVEMYKEGFARGRDYASEAPSEVRVTLKPDAILKKKLDLNDFSARVQTAFRANGIVTLGDILKFSEGEMLCFRNFGVSSLREVRKYVASFGYRLKVQ